MIFKKNNPGCPCCFERCPDCNCDDSRPDMAYAGAWSRCQDCVPGLHGQAQVQYVVCVTEAFTSGVGANAPAVAPPAVGTKIYIESSRGGIAGTNCRYLNTNLAGGEPGLVCRLFMPTVSGTGNFEIDLYYPFTPGAWDFYFHAEFPPSGDAESGNLFFCDKCNTVNNEVVAGDLGGQGKGDFDSFLYKTTAYGGQIKIGPCKNSP